RHAAPLAGATARASAGAVHHVKIATVVNIARTLEELEQLGVWAVGLAGDADEDYDAVGYTAPPAVGGGAEGTGAGRRVGGRGRPAVPTRITTRSTTPRRRRLSSGPRVPGCGDWCGSGAIASCGFRWRAWCRA